MARVDLAVMGAFLVACSGGAHAGNNAGACPTVDAGVQPYESVGSGTFTGPEVSAIVCNAQATIYQSEFTTPPGLFLFKIYSGGSDVGVTVGTPLDASDATFNSGASVGSVTFSSPPGASGATLGGQLSVAAAAPGDYGSAMGQPCGGIVFSYEQPPSSYVSYETDGSNDCLDNSQTTQGTWTLKLTSVTAYSGPAMTNGGAYFIPHGSFTTTMVGGATGMAAGMATLSLTF